LKSAPALFDQDIDAWLGRSDLRSNPTGLGDTGEVCVNDAMGDAWSRDAHVRQRL